VVGRPAQLRELVGRCPADLDPGEPVQRLGRPGAQDRAPAPERLPHGVAPV